MPKALMGAVLALPLAASPAHAADELLLICDGVTYTNVESARTTGAVADNQGYSAGASITTTRPGEVPFRVQFRLLDGAARMNVPAFASGGAKGDANWFPVSNLAVSDSEITGRVKFGFWYGSSNFRIDRRTGTMTTSGGFNGGCQKQDITQRAF